MKPLMPFAIRSSRALFTIALFLYFAFTFLTGLLAEPRVAAAVHLAFRLESMAEAAERQRG